MACSSSKKAKAIALQQGISGQVTEFSGNQMPMKDAPPRTGKPLVTTVFVYEPTHISQVTRNGTAPVYTAISTKLVASAETDSSGSFKIALPIGSYSLFVKQGNTYYANLFDTGNNIALFTVEEGKMTIANLTVTTKATY